jgi:hypothetical protein
VRVRGGARGLGLDGMAESLRCGLVALIERSVVIERRGARRAAGAGSEVSVEAVAVSRFACGWRGSRERDATGGLGRGAFRRRDPREARGGSG